MEEIDSLVQEMFIAMRARGHVPELLLQKERAVGGHCAYARCKQCGLEADALDKPRPNETEIAGPAVALNCEPKPIRELLFRLRGKGDLFGDITDTNIVSVKEEDGMVHIEADFDHVHVHLDDGTEIELGITKSMEKDIKAACKDFDLMARVVAKWIPEELQPVHHSQIVKIVMAG